MAEEITVVQDILDTLGAVPLEVIKPVEESIVTEPVIEDPPVIEEVIVEVPPVEIPVVVVPPIVEVPVEPTIEETLRAEIARLSTLVTSGQLDSGTTQVYPPVTPGEKSTPPSPTTPTIVPANPMQVIIDQLTQGFLTQDELDSVIDKPELINEAYSRSSKKFVENIFALLPQLVNQSVSQEIQKNKLVTTFYEMYGDLKPYGDFVRLNMAEIERQNPTKTYKDIFEETAMVCRKRLGFKETPSVKVGVQPDGKLLPPAFAGSKGNSGKPSGSVVPKPIFDENAADILELVSRQ